MINKITKKSLYIIICSFHISLFSSIKNYDQWAMFMPQKDTVAQQNHQSHQSAYMYLEDLGRQAHSYWLQQTQLEDKITFYHELFSTVNAAFLISVIDEILKSDEIITRITQTSYKNITGFLKIVLVSSDKESWKLRLHIWQEDGIEDLHNHKWDFYSKIIQGTIIQDTYTIANNYIDRKNSQKYSIREPISLMPQDVHGKKPCPCRDLYSLKSSNNFAYLYKSSSTIISENFSYYMPYDLIHTIKPSQDAVTFVFTSEQVQENSNVFLLNSQYQKMEIQRYAPSITKQEIQAALINLKNKLERNCRVS